MGTTFVYVTHDQIEAMTLATKIAVLKDGVLQQFGTPAEIYNSPANLFVADFMVGEKGSDIIKGLPALPSAIFAYERNDTRPRARAEIR